MDSICSFDLVDDLEVPVPSEENDVVHLELFWEKMENSLIVRGLITGVRFCYNILACLTKYSSTAEIPTTHNSYMPI